MRLGALSLAVVMVLGLTADARADEDVDWSEFVDNNPRPEEAPAKPATIETKAPRTRAKPRATKRVARAKRVTKVKTRKKARRR